MSRAKELFENELEKALPDLPEDVAIDVATEPLKQARQRSGLKENAFLRKNGLYVLVKQSMAGL